MDNMLLSICIPTYNRKDALESHLYNVFQQLCTFNSSDVEVVISVNPSGDGSEEIAQRYMNKDNCIVNINENNIGGTNNFVKLFTLSNAKYIWFACDDDILVDGLIRKVVEALRKHKDITWLFINSARTRISPKSHKEIIIETKSYLGDGGYFRNGFKKLNSVFREIDNRLLFSTSNVYLKNAGKEIMMSFPKENNCRQLAYVYHSIGNGAAYIIAEPSIVAGCETTWNDRYYETEVRHFNNSLLKIGELDEYDRKFAVGLVKYRMTHEAIDVWFEIYKMILKHPKVGFSDYAFYLKLFPITTLFMTITAPFSAVYLIIRHSLRNRRRRKQLLDLMNCVSAPEELISRCEM